MLEELEQKIKIAQNLHSQNKFDLARNIYKETLRLDPKNINVLYLIGTLEIQTQNYKAGIFYLLKAIDLKPNIVQFHNNLAVAYTELNFIEKALNSINRAISIKNDYFEGFNTLGNIYSKQGKIDNAIKSYNKAISLNPKYVEAYNNLGIAHKNQKKLQNAKLNFLKALSINPNHLSSLINLGNNYQELYKYSDAIKTYKKVIEIDPNYSEAYINIAKVLELNNEYDKAKTYFENGISLNQNNTNHLNDFGLFYLRQKSYDYAVKYFEKALLIKPQSFEFMKNIGICFYENFKFNKAITYFEKSLILDIKSSEIYNFLGNCFYKLGYFEKAKEAYKKGIKIKSNSASLNINMGRLLFENKKFEESIAYYEKGLKIDNSQYQVLGQLLHIKMLICDWNYFDTNLKKIEKLIKKNIKVIEPLVSLSLYDNPKFNQSVAKIHFNSNFVKPSEVYKNKFQKINNNKIKVAYFSSDFQQDHPISYLTKNLFEKHNRDDFEIYLFSLEPTTKNDSFRKKIKSEVSYFYDIENKSDNEVLSLCRSLNLDIAVDLNGYTKCSRPNLFNCKVAPVQINFLGFPGTLGCENYDYILVDKYVVPKEYKNFYNEKILYMPDCYLINPSHREVAKPNKNKSFYGLPEHSFTFCCFNNTYKILPNIHQVWANILNATENTVLWLADTNDLAKKNLLDNFHKKGINPKRIIFAKRLTKIEEHLSRYKFVDLFLDTFPYNAHTTASDALHMGTPILTIHGKSFQSRVGLSLMKNLSMDELITNNERDYERKAIYFARNKGVLNELIKKLKLNVRSSAVFNPDLYVKNLEKNYKKILN